MATVPRFSHFASTSEKASKVKQRTRSRDTKAEIALRKELWRRGLRYRLHGPDLPGKPDVVFRSAKVVVFCDGDFWHGRRWAERFAKLARGSNSVYWTAKIAANRERDRRSTRLLRAAGWTVVRLWETDILRDVQRAATRVEGVLRSRLER